MIRQSYSQSTAIQNEQHKVVDPLIINASTHGMKHSVENKFTWKSFLKRLISQTLHRKATKIIIFHITLQGNKGQQGALETGQRKWALV